MPWFKKHNFLVGAIIYTLVWVVLYFVNIPPQGHFFIGWDSLTPELNPVLNFKRAFMVWQDFQGLGLVGGHGYWASLPHTIVIWILSVFLPTYLLRYTFTLLCLYFGGLGVYFLTRWVIKNLASSKLKNDNLTFPCLVAALFYILNIGTIQNFYIQLEAFIVHFAVFPFLLLSLLDLLLGWNLKRLIKFSLFNILILPAAFIPPVFIVQNMIISVFLGLYLLMNFGKLAIKKTLQVLLIIFAVNAFWLLPFFYYTLNYSSNYLTAYNNQNSTQDFIDKNQNYSGIKNVSLAKSFLLDGKDTDEFGASVLIFSNWLGHLSNKTVTAIGYVCFAISITGLLAVYKYKQNRFLSVGFTASFIMLFTLLATGAFPFSIINQVLRDISPLFAQSFRISFTKVSISYVLYLAVFLGVGVYALVDSKLMPVKRPLFSRITRILSLLLLPALLYYGLPAFKGNLLYRRMVLPLPQEYLDFIAYMNEKPRSGRVMDLPQGWSWGWSIMDWGYTGSGFLHYGIEQPIMHRSFDVWSPYNEHYYWEVTNALFTRDTDQLQEVLQKYNIAWVWYDPSVLAYPEYKGAFEGDVLEDLLSKSPILYKDKSFGNKILYRVQNNNKTKTRITLSGVLGQDFGDMVWQYSDPAYSTLGDYINIYRGAVSDGISLKAYFPFQSLFVSRYQKFNAFSIDPNVDFYSFSNSTVEGWGQEVHYGVLDKIPVNVYATLVASGEIKIRIKPQEISINGVLISPDEYSLVLSPSKQAINKTYVVNRLVRLPLTDLAVGEEKNLGSFVLELNDRNYIALEDEDRVIIDSASFNYDDRYKLTKTISSEEKVELRINRNLGAEVSYDSNKDPSFLNHKRHDCLRVLDQEAVTKFNAELGKSTLVLGSNSMGIGQEECFSVILDHLPNSLAYLVDVKYKLNSGSPVSVAIVDKGLKYTLYQKFLRSEDKDKESSFYYFLTPRIEDLSKGGYSITFRNLPGFDNKTEIVSVSLTPVPYNTVSRLHLIEKEAKNIYLNRLTPTKNIGYWFYLYKTSYYRKTDLLETDRSFSKNLIPVCFGKYPNPFSITKCPLKTHIKNGWEQVFMFNNDFKGRVILVYTPQLYQFLGYVVFVLFSACLIWLYARTYYTKRKPSQTL